MDLNNIPSKTESQPIEQDKKVVDNDIVDMFASSLSLPIEDEQAKTKFPKCENCKKLEKENQDLTKVNEKLKSKIMGLNKYIKNMSDIAKLASNKNMEDKKPTQEGRKENEVNTDGPGKPTGYVKAKVNEETGDDDCCQNLGKYVMGKEKRPLDNALPSVYTRDEEPPFPPMNVNNCPCSCGLYVLLCLLREKHGYEYCPPKFSQMISSEGILEPNRCSDILEDIRKLSYVERVFRCEDIAAGGGLDQVLRSGLEKLEGFVPEQTLSEETYIPEEISDSKPLRKRLSCGILSYKTDLYHHAVMIMRFHDINSPEVEMKIYDPQKHKWFPNSEPRLDMIHYVEITAIKEDEGGPLIREWLDQCSMKICEEEFKELGNASPSQCFDTSTSETETTTRFL